MKLISVILEGKYKGLRDQSFGFSRSDGHALALVGMNGSGKSQFLELVCETFAWLERRKRADFRVRKPLPFKVTIEYQLYPYLSPDQALTYKVAVSELDDVCCWLLSDGNWVNYELNAMELPQHIVGYSSGLNENLQRSFMKNALQYYEVMQVRARRRNLLNSATTIEEKNEINEEYNRKHFGIFFPTHEFEMQEYDYTSLSERDTDVPMMLFLDYDCNALLMASLGMLESEELYQLFPEIAFHCPVSVELLYDLRKATFDEDAIRDIKQLIRVAGDHALEAVSQRTSDEAYELHDLDYLSAKITLDLTNRDVRERLRDEYSGRPLRLFEKLYKIQLLGVKAWQQKDKTMLRRDDFLGNVKKPLKTRLPISVTQLRLRNGADQSIDFDDLSDGEAQLIQTIGAVRVFRGENTLFVFDEPETHLNPSWRTYYHRYFLQALHSMQKQTESRIQLLLSTHSPFLISSLQRDDVYKFECLEDEGIRMYPAGSQTFGASFETLIKQFFGLKSLISQTAIEEIKRHIDSGNREETRDWIEQNLGDSMEKAYLLRKLRD